MDFLHLATWNPSPEGISTSNHQAMYNPTSGCFFFHSARLARSVSKVQKTDRRIFSRLSLPLIFQTDLTGSDLAMSCFEKTLNPICWDKLHNRPGRCVTGFLQLCLCLNYSPYTVTSDSHAGGRIWAVFLGKNHAGMFHVLAQARSCPCGTNSQECHDPLFNENFCYPLADFWLLGPIRLGVSWAMKVIYLCCCELGVIHAGWEFLYLYSI